MKKFVDWVTKHIITSLVIILLLLALGFVLWFASILNMVQIAQIDGGYTDSMNAFILFAVLILCICVGCFPVVAGWLAMSIDSFIRGKRN